MKKSIRQYRRTYSDSFIVAYAEQYAVEHQISKEKALQIIITEWLPIIAQYALGFINNINFNPCPIQNSSVQNINFSTIERNPAITDCISKEMEEGQKKEKTKKEEIKENIIQQNTEPVKETPKEEDIQLLNMLVKNDIALGKRVEETIEKVQGNFSFDVSPYVQEMYVQKPKVPLTDEETSMFVV